MFNAHPGCVSQLLSGQHHTSLSFLKALSRRFEETNKSYRQCQRVYASINTKKRGSPRPDAAVIEKRRSEKAEGGSDTAYAPRGSLFALQVQAKRRSAAELLHEDNKFPFQDSFSLGDGRCCSSTEIMAHLDGQVLPERLGKIQQVVAGRTWGVIPMLEGIYDRGNIGAVARSADALGFGALHYVKTLDPRRLKGGGSGQRTSGGSQKWLDIQAWDSTRACLTHLKAAGYFIAATHLAPESVPITELDWTRPTVIILGNESYGVSHEALSFADQPVIIPQAPGFVDSFNVSVASALALYEARTSRIRALRHHGDLTAEQQQVLAAAMLLRHKEYNACVRLAQGLSLEELEALDKVAVGEEILWSEERTRRYRWR